MEETNQMISLFKQMYKMWENLEENSRRKVFKKNVFLNNKTRL